MVIAMSDNDAIEELARVLYEGMEHLDPDDDYVEWDVASEIDKSYYRECIFILLSRKLLIKRALNLDATTER